MSAHPSIVRPLTEERSLFDLDIAVSEEFSWSVEWEELLKNSVARDLFLAIGSCHLRGEEFFADALRVAEMLDQDSCPCCGQAFARIETTQDLIRLLRAVCHDQAMKYPWGTRPELRRELRLRELIEMIKGRRHMKFHVVEHIRPKPGPDLLGHNHEFEI